MKEYIERVHYLDGGTVIKTVTERVGELIRCKDCKYDHECTHMMVRRSVGGGNIYCPVTYCSEGKRKEE